MPAKFNPSTGELFIEGVDPSAASVSDEKISNYVDRGNAYYLTSAASDQGGSLLEMINTIPLGGGFGISSSGVSDGDTLAEFCTVDGFPNADFLSSGVMTFRIQARQSAGTKTSKIYAEFYRRTVPGGVETLLATTEVSALLNTFNIEAGGEAVTSVIGDISATDRIVVKVKALVEGTGTDPDITLDIQGINYSRISLPIEQVQAVDISSKQDLISALNNQFIYQNNSGTIEGSPSISRNNTSGGIAVTPTMEPDNGTYLAINSFDLAVDPLQNSPDELYVIISSFVDIDVNSSGFTLGTNGSAVKFLSNFAQHLGTSDVGFVSFLEGNFNLGNGTDAIDVKGVSYSYGFGTINQNVTISSAIQGYGFQPQMNATALFGASGYVQAFYDNAVINCASNYYNSYASNPTIASISDGSNYTGFNCNPTVPVFTGSASFFGINIAGTLGTFGATGYYSGINIAPSITSVPSATGIYVSMAGVTGTEVLAIDALGDFRLTGDTTFNGSLTVGGVEAFKTQALVDGGGNPSQIHSLVTAPTVAASASLTTGDMIAVNFPALINIGASATVSTAFIGVAAAGLPAVVNMGAGSTLDRLYPALFALSLDATAGGGTIDEVGLCRTIAIPNGVTTVTNLKGFVMDLPFGDPGTNSWGVYITPEIDNFMAGFLKLGGTDQVSNDNIALEIGHGDRAFLNAKMSTATRDLMTPIEGMQIFNLTTSKLQVYASSSWVDLH